MKQFFLLVSLSAFVQSGFSQNVGIGITNPIGKTHIVTTGDTSTLMLGFNSTSSYRNVLDIKSSGMGSLLLLESSNVNAHWPIMKIKQEGSGHGLKIENKNGIGIEITTASVPNPAILADNSDGEAIVGRNTGINTFAAVVGRNDSSGIGVKGINTKSGTAVVGHSSHGATGKAASFVTYNPANSSNVVDILGAGSGIMLNINTTNQNGSNPVTLISASGGPARPHLALQQYIFGEWTRVRMSNSNIATAYWDIASYNSTVDANSAMNFFYRSTGGSGLNVVSVKGNGNVVVAGTLSDNSDIRLKKDITPLANSLVKIQSLNGYHYHWKDAGRDTQLQTGIIAQEVEKQMPELVQESEDGTKSVNYLGLIPYLIESIKSQQQEIELLKKKVQELSKTQSK